MNTAKMETREFDNQSFVKRSSKQLSEVVTKITTKSTSKEHPSLKFIGMDSIEPHSLRPSILYDFNDFKSSANLFKINHVLYGRMRPYLNKVYKAEFNGACSGEFIVMECGPNINPDYLKYVLHSQQFVRYANTKTSGDRPRVSFDDIGEYSLYIPSIHKQRAIVNKIEELFSELDKGIEQLKTTLQQLKTYRQAVLNWAFEGRLTNTRVKIGELPKGWAKVCIKDIAEVFSGYAFKSQEFTQSGKFQVLRMGNVRPGLLRLDESPVFIEGIDKSVLNRFQLLINDVVITQTGTRKKRDYGYTVIIHINNLLLNQRLASVRLQAKYSPKFFLYYTWTEEFKNQFFANETGNVGQGNVGIKGITESLIPICSLNEQEKIVLEIERRLSVANKLEESIVNSLQQAEALKQSILKRAFEGKLVASDTTKTFNASVKVIPIERKALAGKIIHLSHDDKHFGLTKFQKMLYLVENFAEVPYENNFIRDTAGPYDKEFALEFRKEMQEKGWAHEEPQKRITKLIPGDRIEQLIQDYTTYFRDRETKITFVLNHIKSKSTHDAELIATLYAVWNNRLIKKKAAKINLLIEDFFNWSSKKKEEFQEEEIRSTYDWMKKNKFVPSGFGKTIELEN